MAYARSGGQLPSQLNGAKYFLGFNLHAGYHHKPLEEASVPKTGFTSPFGKYEYLKVPFGLAQASAEFLSSPRKSNIRVMSSAVLASNHYLPRQQQLK